MPTWIELKTKKCQNHFKRVTYFWVSPMLKKWFAWIIFARKNENFVILATSRIQTSFLLVQWKMPTWSEPKKINLSFWPIFGVTRPIAAARLTGWYLLDNFEKQTTINMSMLRIIGCNSNDHSLLQLLQNRIGFQAINKQVVAPGLAQGLRRGFWNS